MDLGSGAGFPGLPLAILWPERRVTLVESRTKRHHFQQHVVRSLGLENADPRLGRMEQLEPRPHDLVLAQAVGPVEEVLRLAVEWVAPGGQVAVPGLRASPGAASRGYSSAGLAHYRMPCSRREIPVWLATRARR